MARFLPPDHGAGDPNTIGGYRAVHGRPAAFEGRDGSAYSVEIVVDDTGDRSAPYAGYLLFVRWGQGDPVAVGHVETEYLIHAMTEADVLAELGTIRLSDATARLNALLAPSSSRPWYEVMQDDADDDV